MKYLMIFLALLCFGFAFWVVQWIRSDIQLILLGQAVIGGMIFVGFAAVLNEMDARR